jgi:AcrR family transcriptional regulator
MSPRKREQNEELRDMRRAQILDATLTVYIECGFNGTDMDQVAEKAGLAKGLVYYYFKTKLELFKAMFENAFTATFELNSALLSSNTEQEPIGRLTRYLLDILGLAEREPRLLRFAMRLPFDAYAVFGRDGWKAGFERSRTFMSSIAAMIKDIADAGGLPEPSADPDRAAMSLWAIFMANCLDMSKMVGAMKSASPEECESAKRARVHELLGFCFRMLGVGDDTWTGYFKGKKS